MVAHVSRDRQLQAHKWYLHLMNVSMLGILLNPLLWILLPAIFWFSKKDSSSIVNLTGEKIIDFQITMIVLIFSIPVLASWMWESTLFYNIISNTLFSHQQVNRTMPIMSRLMIVLHLWNFFMVSWNAWRIQNNLEVNYFPGIPFFRFIVWIRTSALTRD